MVVVEFGSETPKRSTKDGESQWKRKRSAIEDAVDIEVEDAERYEKYKEKA